MAKIENLRLHRKRRARDAARRKGYASAAKHGRSRAEDERDALERSLADRRLDGHRRDDVAGQSDQETQPDD